MIATTDFTAMFLLGFLGTGHCIGMCGPLIVAFPGATGRVSAHFFYNFGRVLTYTAVGAAMAAAGSGVVKLAGIIGTDPLRVTTWLQIGVSLFAASFLFVFGLTRLGLIPEPRFLSIAEPQRIPGYGKVLRQARMRGNFRDMTLTGLVFGFLPCGLSYAAFSRALAAGSPATGAAMTLAFGVGTLPGLLLLGIGATGFFRKYRVVSDLLSGMLMIGMAIALAAEAFA